MRTAIGGKASEARAPYRFNLAATLMSGAADWIRVVTIVVFTLTAAIIDVRTRRIPNWLTVSAFFAALAFYVFGGGSNFGVDSGFQGLLYSLGGFAVGFGILFVLWLIGKGGAGDVKLMGAVGAWLGPMFTVFAYVLSVCFAVLGSILVLCLMVTNEGVSPVRRRLFSRPSKTPASDERRTQLARKHRLMTYALPVALGTWLVLVWQFVGHKH